MKKFAYLIISILLFSGMASSIHAAEISTKSNSPMNSSMSYTHTVFVGIATGQFCEPCDQWGQDVYDTYNSGNYDFHYVEMITHDYNGQKLNENANDWRKNYSITNFPTTIFDGDFERIVGGAQPELIPPALNSCGNRVVSDISAEMTVSFLGDATIKVDIIVQNNGQSQYSGLIRAYITEIVSRYKTYYGNNYHFGFLDYAFNKVVNINGRGTYMDSVTWNGNEHHDNHGDYFGDIESENIQVVLEIANVNNNKYVDETVMARITNNNNSPPYPPSNPSPSDGALDVQISQDLSWSCTDPDGGPLQYDVYFGPNNPPEQVAWKQTGRNYDPGMMEYNTTFYWKIVAWDFHDASTSGPIWSFTTGKQKNRAPKVFINKPLQALYLFDNEIMLRLFRLTKIIGDITIIANATDEDENIEKVDFFINGELKGTDNTKPYEYLWTWDRLRLFHLFLIEVKVYDLEGEFSSDSTLVRKFL